MVAQVVPVVKWSPNGRPGASDVRYSHCRNRARVDVRLSVGIGITVKCFVSLMSNKCRLTCHLVVPYLTDFQGECVQGRPKFL